jgi:hypothetical protein
VIIDPTLRFLTASLLIDRNVYNDSTLEISLLHQRILQHILSYGHAPDNATLAAEFGVSEQEVVSVLRSLADYHGVVLHPHTPQIWVIHPFSLAPTNFVVENSTGQWWSNCAWCALGAAALLGTEVTIRTTLGADGRQVELHIRDGELLETGYWVHFPVPMQKAWENVIFTCSTMLLFESENEVDAWCKRHAISKGDLQPVSTIWEFAKVWYGRHLDPDWKKWSTDEAAQIFQRFGLIGPTWELQSSDQRF